MPRKVLFLTGEVPCLAGYQHPLKQSRRSWPKQTECSLGLLLQTRQALLHHALLRHLQRLWHTWRIRNLSLQDVTAGCSKRRSTEPTLRLTLVTTAFVAACKDEAPK